MSLFEIALNMAWACAIFCIFWQTMQFLYAVFYYSLLPIRGEKPPLWREVWRILGHIVTWCKDIGMSVLTLAVISLLKLLEVHP
jgi:hypothetical protein